MRLAATAPRLAALLAGVLLLAGCPQEPRERPDVMCADACKQRIVGCSDHQCERGCAFILDRLVERQQDPILRCMMSAKTCNDHDWADCAVRIGVHADGGPPVPAPIDTEEPSD